MCEVLHRAVAPRCAGGLSAALLAAAGPAPPAAITGEEALHRLMQGNARYRSNHVDARDFAAGRAARVTTHTPDCFDSELFGCTRRAGVRVRPGTRRSVRGPRRRQHSTGRGPGQPGVRSAVSRFTADLRTRPQQLRRGRGSDQGGAGQRRASGSSAGVDRSDEARRAGGAGDTPCEPAERRDRRKCPHDDPGRRHGAADGCGNDRRRQGEGRRRCLRHRHRCGKLV